MQQRHESRERSEDRERRPPKRSRPSMSAAEAAQLGLEQVAGLTGHETQGVVSVEAGDDGWVIGVEVVEDRRIPSSTDVLAIYEAELDGDGELVGYARRRRYTRSQSDAAGSQR